MQTDTFFMSEIPNVFDCLCNVGFSFLQHKNNQGGNTDKTKQIYGFPSFGTKYEH